MTKRYVTNRPLSIEFKGEKVEIPTGHPVDVAHNGNGEIVQKDGKRFYFAGRPETLLDRRTQGMALHDATYYGIPIPEDAVSEA
jgi:hypothetical protein